MRIWLEVAALVGSTDGAENATQIGATKIAAAQMTAAKETIVSVSGEAP